MRVLSENSGFRNPENPLKVLQTMLGGGDAPLAGMFGGNSPLQGMTSQLLEGLQVLFNSFFVPLFSNNRLCIFTIFSSRFQQAQMQGGAFPLAPAELKPTEAMSSIT